MSGLEMLGIGPLVFTPAQPDHSAVKLRPASANNDKAPKVHSQGAEVVAEVDDRTVLLYSFKEDEAGQESATQSSVNMEKAFAGGDPLKLEFDFDDTTFYLNGLPVLDFSREAAGQDSSWIYGQANRFAADLENAGIIQYLEVKAARSRLEVVERQAPNRFRDERVKGWLEIASLSYSLGELGEQEEMGRAEDCCRRVINNRNFVTARAASGSDEAVFMLADIYRSRAEILLDEGLLLAAKKLLCDGEERLRSLEDGYRARYNLEFLSLALTYRRYYDNGIEEMEDFCQPDKLDEYLNNATFEYNSYAPTFKDNFVAVKAYLAYADYQREASCPDKAAAGYDAALALIGLIENPLTVTTGDTGEKWEKYSVYLENNSPNSVLAEKWFGQRAGLIHYSYHSDVSRFFRHAGSLISGAFYGLMGLPAGRVDFSGVRLSEQFDGKLFRLYKARAFLGKAWLAEKKEEREMYLAQAEALAAAVRRDYGLYAHSSAALEIEEIEKEISLVRGQGVQE